ncbi:MAG: GIY-YIG nuclease family protein [Prosthecobacter sp.]|nr:GIY-YIG nuclease family protein [Prosthecobacter sp.]
MAQLSDDQKRFLEKQRIPLSRVFDASDMQRCQYQELMKELDMLVAIGVSACSKGGHTMRTRKGHCVQCGTHNLAFLLRYEEAGEVYVAVSRQGNFVKVGMAGLASVRQESLNRLGYGGVSDWIIRYKISCRKGGSVEFRAHNLLAAYRLGERHSANGGLHSHQELFDCDFSVAIQAVEQAVRAISPESLPLPLDGKNRKDARPQPKSLGKPQNQKGAVSSASLPATKKAVDAKKRSIRVPRPITVNGLAEALGIKPYQVIRHLLAFKVLASGGDYVIRPDLAEAICKLHGCIYRHDAG